MDANSQRELARLLAGLRRDGRQQSGLASRCDGHTAPTFSRPLISFRYFDLAL
jgi:hypothetical protein